MISLLGMFNSHYLQACMQLNTAAGFNWSEHATKASAADFVDPNSQYASGVSGAIPEGSNGGGEAVSISDVAKTLLESTKDDRLDFRLEAAELLRSSTESLCRIRGKWECKQMLSRAEWILLGHYIQMACEELSANPALPSPSAFAVVLNSLSQFAPCGRIEASAWIDII